MGAFEDWWMEFLGSDSLLEMTQTEQCYEAFKAGEKAGMLAAAEIANSQDAPNDALKIRDAICRAAEETAD